MIRTWRILKQAVKDFLGDDVLTLSAGLSFYSALSMAPLVMILLGVAGYISEDLVNALLGQIHGLIGQKAGQGLSLVIANARQQEIGSQIAGFGIVAMLLSATLVFAHLRSSLDKIWKVKSERSGIILWLLTRLTALGLVVIIGILLLVSLVLSASLQLLFSDTSFWKVIDTSASLIMYVLLFGAVYRLVPSAKVRWRDVLVGSSITALLFLIGKWGISRYLGYAAVGSVYGAAGSIIVLLVWIYYASIVFFFGAEITHAYTEHSKSPKS